MPNKNKGKKDKFGQNKENTQDNMQDLKRFEKRSKQAPEMKHPRQSGRGRGK